MSHELALWVGAKPSPSLGPQFPSYLGEPNYSLVPSRYKVGAGRGVEYEPSYVIFYVYVHVCVNERERENEKPFILKFP